jgi:SAM-dependent methyltransferase
MNNWVESIERGAIYSDTSYDIFERILRCMKKDTFASVITRFVSREKHICETGCGMGFTSFYLARDGYRVTALDISSKILGMLQRFAHKEIDDGSIHNGNIRFLCTDILDLGIKSRKIDLIFNHGVYEHFLEQSDRRLVLSNMRSCLVPAGILIIAVPNLGNPFFAMSIRKSDIPEMVHFTVETLGQELVEEGFDLMESGGLFVGPGYQEWVRSPWLSKVIGMVGLVWQLLPKLIKRKFGAHLYVVGQKTT